MKLNNTLQAHALYLITERPDKETGMAGIREQVCRRIQALRKQAGLTQEQLAAQADLSVDGIRKIETLRTTPTLETLQKLGLVFQMSLPELLQLEGLNTPEKQELEQLHLYLSSKNENEIRIARKVVQAVLEELE